MSTQKQLNARLKIFQKRFEKVFALRNAKEMMKLYHQNVVIVGEKGVNTGRRKAFNLFKEIFRTAFEYKIRVTSNTEIENGRRWIQKGFIEFKNANEGKIEIKFEQQCRRMPNGKYLIDSVTNFGTKTF